MAKWIKNNDTIDHTWVSQLVPSGTYYKIQPTEEIKWASDVKLLADISNNIAIVAKDDSGLNNIINISEAIDHLKGNLPSEVVTQRDKDDKRTQMASGEASVDAQGVSTVEIKIPGVFDGTDPKVSSGRFIDSGVAWFDLHHSGDKISEVKVIDKDNLLGAGVGYEVAAYHDKDVPLANQGWIIPKHRGDIKLQTIGIYGFLPSGFYLTIIGKKGESQTTGTMYMNVKWGKRI